MTILRLPLETGVKAKEIQIMNFKMVLVFQGELQSHSSLGGGREILRPGCCCLINPAEHRFLLTMGREKKHKAPDLGLEITSSDTISCNYAEMDIFYSPMGLLWMSPPSSEPVILLLISIWLRLQRGPCPCHALLFATPTAQIIWASINYSCTWCHATWLKWHYLTYNKLAIKQGDLRVSGAAFKVILPSELKNSPVFSSSVNGFKTPEHPWKASEAWSGDFKWLFHLAQVGFSRKWKLLALINKGGWDQSVSFISWS